MENQVYRRRHKQPMQMIMMQIIPAAVGMVTMTTKAAKTCSNTHSLT